MIIKRLNIIFLFVMSMMLFLMSSCSIETYATKKISADNEIASYISVNELNSTKYTSGLVFVPLNTGNGENAKAGDKVAFHYTGYFLNGEKFDSSYDKSYPLIVELGNGQLIKGLEQALTMMNKGAKAKAIIPFYIAYDDMENGPVPPYSNLIFDIEILDINVKK